MLQEIVTGCASLGGPPELDAFRKHLPREWIEEALRATGTATLRRRRLPAEQVVWLVLGMALLGPVDHGRSEQARPGVARLGSRDGGSERHFAGSSAAGTRAGAVAV